LTPSAGFKPFVADARRLGALAWPVFIGQIAVVAFATVDTLLLGRFAPAQLAALAVGGAIYMTLFIGLMGVVLALAPIAGQLFGASRHEEAGAQLHQAVWLALACCVPGWLLLAFPEPLLALAQATPEVQAQLRRYLWVLMLGLPASLLFTAYRAFNTAVSRPQAVMALQVAGLLVKLPATALLVRGEPMLGLPAQGVVGCAIGTVLAHWVQVGLAFWLLRRDNFYAPFKLRGRGLHRPDGAAIKAQLKLGLPTGLSLLVEVSGFTLMAIFISRMGTLPVAGHQIAVNLVSLMFMVPLALAQAASTLVAQHVGAGELARARSVGWHGVQLALLLSAAMGAAVFALREPLVALYTPNAALAAAAVSLLAWLALFHVGDALQAVAAFVLRAWKMATVPLLIYVASLWGIGLGGGYWLGFNVPGHVPQALQGAPGYWAAATAGLAVAGASLCGYLAWAVKRQPGLSEAARASARP
jgi:multidrug resistance protein, MATE family